MNIKVVGSGCSRCVSFAQNVEEAVLKRRLNEVVERVFDLDEVKRYGIKATPALVIDEQVITSGELLEQQEIINHLESVRLKS